MKVARHIFKCCSNSALRSYRSSSNIHRCSAPYCSFRYSIPSCRSFNISCWVRGDVSKHTTPWRRRSGDHANVSSHEPVYNDIMENATDDFRIFTTQLLLIQRVPCITESLRSLSSEPWRWRYTEDHTWMKPCHDRFCPQKGMNIPHF